MSAFLKRLLFIQRDFKNKRTELNWPSLFLWKINGRCILLALREGDENKTSRR